MSMLRLSEIARLLDGWNGPRSKAPTHEAVKTAHNMTPVPLDNGGIQIDLHAGGSDIEIEIGPDGVVASVMWSRPTVP